MKTITLNIIKKNRVYFKCTTENGYSVKLRITKKSENLTLGTHNLLVNDVSVRTKYGTDVIYELEDEIKKDEIVTLSHFKYNEFLVNACRNLGGVWDRESKIWVFPAFVEDKVEELDYKYNTDIVTVEITAKEDLFRHNSAIEIAGYTIAEARDRDSGATLGDGVSMISGKIDSGGSLKNWGTSIEKNSVFRLKMSKNLMDDYRKDEWDLKIISEEGVL